MSDQVTPEQARAELARRRSFQPTPEQARAELARRRGAAPEYTGTHPRAPGGFGLQQFAPPAGGERTFFRGQVGRPIAEIPLSRPVPGAPNAGDAFRPPSHPVAPQPPAGPKSLVRQGVERIGQAAIDPFLGPAQTIGDAITPGGASPRAGEVIRAGAHALMAPLAAQFAPVTATAQAMAEKDEAVKGALGAGARPEDLPVAGRAHNLGKMSQVIEAPFVHHGEAAEAAKRLVSAEPGLPDTGDWIDTLLSIAKTGNETAGDIAATGVDLAPIGAVPAAIGIKRGAGRAARAGLESIYDRALYTGKEFHRVGGSKPTPAEARINKAQSDGVISTPEARAWERARANKPIQDAAAAALDPAGARINRAVDSGVISPAEAAAFKRARKRQSQATKDIEKVESGEATPKEHAEALKRQVAVEDAPAPEPAARKPGAAKLSEAGETARTSLGDKGAKFVEERVKSLGPDEVEVLYSDPLVPASVYARELAGRPFGRASERGSIDLGHRRVGERATGSTVASSIDDGLRRAIESAEGPIVAGIDKVLGRPLRSVPDLLRKTKAGTTVADTARSMFFTDDWVSKEFGSLGAERKGAARLAKHDAMKSATRLEKSMEALSAAERDAVYEYLGGESKTLPMAMEKSRALLDGFKRDVYEDAARLVDLNYLHPEAAAEFAEGYLYRSYDTKKSPTLEGSRLAVEKSFYRKDRPAVEMKLPEKAVRELAQGLPADRIAHRGGVTVAKFADAAARETFMQRAVEAGHEIHKIVEPLSKEQRRTLKEMRDPSQALHLTMTRNKHLISTLEYLKGLENGSDAKGAWVKSPEAGKPLSHQVAPEGYTKVPEGTRMGPLQNKYIRADVMEAISRSVGESLSAPKSEGGVPLPKQAAHALWDFADGFTNQFKINKTLLNPATAFRQGPGNISFSMFMDVSLLNPNNWGLYREAMRAMKTDSPMNSELIKAGVKHVQWTDVDLRIAEKLISGKGNGTPAFRAGQWLANPIMQNARGRSITRGAARFYSFWDEIIRTAGYLKQRKRGKSMQEARRFIDTFSPNYENAPAVAKSVSKLPLFGSPFFLFKYEVYRTYLNAMRAKPIRAGLAISQNALWKGLALKTIADLITDEEMEAIEEIHGKFKVPLGRNDEGAPLVYDTEYVDPTADLPFLGDGPFFSSPFDGPAITGVRSTANALGLTEAPALSAAQMLTGNEDRMGRTVMPSDSSIAGGARHALGKFYEAFGPGLTPFVGREFRKLAGMDERDKRDLSMRFVDALMGVRIRPIDYKRDRQVVGIQAGSALRGIPKDADDRDERRTRVKDEKDRLVNVIRAAERQP